MAQFDNTLGMWKADNGTYWATKEEAQSADGTPSLTSPQSAAQSSDFFGGGTLDAPVVRGAVDGDSLSNAIATQKQNVDTQQRRDDAANIANAPFERMYGDPNQYAIDPNTGKYYTGDERPSMPGNLGTDLLSLGSTLGGVALNPLGSLAKFATGVDAAKYLGGPGAVGQYALDKVAGVTNASVDNTQGASGSGSSSTPNYGQLSGAGGLGAGNPGVPAQTQDAIAGADQNVTDAKGAYDDKQTSNDAEDPSLLQQALTAANGVQGPDYSQSDQSRKDQQEGLAQQRALMARLQAFDPEQYATQFADQTLARQVALARGSSSSPAAQQAATMAAMDQAPALYAQGRAQADTLESQRLQAAEQAAQGFGSLATNTRTQDAGQTQFDASFGLDIAQNIETVTQGTVKINDAEAAQLADVFTNMARVASVYDKWPVDEQLAYLEDQVRLTLGDKQLQGIEETLKANGAVKPKDLLNGLFGLVGDVPKFLLAAKSTGLLGTAAVAAA